MLQASHNRREFLQQSATAEFLGIMKNNLDTEDATKLKDAMAVPRLGAEQDSAAGVARAFG